MFYTKERNLLSDGYFTILREIDNCIIVRSNNTGHCWLLQKMPAEVIGWARIKIGHKHTIKTAHFHDHAKARNVECAIKMIKDHDDYVLHPEKYKTGTFN